jgi:predicted O-methyltransferase YrrM
MIRPRALKLVRRPPQMSWGRFVLGLFVPHSLATMALDAIQHRWLQESRRLQLEHASREDAPPYSYEAAVAHLVDRGLPEDQIRAGSMPEASLSRCGELLEVHLDAARPLAMLHVGNFVGVSLSWFADYAHARNRWSRVVGIDPNVTHRGIQRPQDHVISILARFGLEAVVMLVTGYTLEKNAVDLDRADANRSFALDQSCEDALSILADLAPDSFDLAIIDGNHDGDYLRHELSRIRRLLRSGGLLVLDDVFAWHGLPAIARELDASEDATLLLRDSRLGVWQLAKMASSRG